MSRAVTSNVYMDTGIIENAYAKILLINTRVEKEYKVYRELKDILADYPSTTGTDPDTGETVTIFDKTYLQAKAILSQNSDLPNAKKITQVHIVGFGDVSAAEDIVVRLEELQGYQNEWIAFHTDREDMQTIQIMSAWAQATWLSRAEINAGYEEHPKLYFYRLVITDKLLDDLELGTLVLDKENAIPVATEYEDEEIDAMYSGNFLSFYPHSATGKFKCPNGLKISKMHTSTSELLEEKLINFYGFENNGNFMKNGTTTGGNFIDTVISRNLIKKEIDNEIYSLYKETEKISYNNDGFAAIGGRIARALTTIGDEYGHIAKNDRKELMIEVRIPVRTDATKTEASQRKTPKFYWKAIIDGAVHQTPIEGVMTVDTNTGLTEYINNGLVA